MRPIEIALVYGISAVINLLLWLSHKLIDPSTALTWRQHLQAQGLCLVILLGSTVLALIIRKITNGKNKKDPTIPEH